MGYVPQGRAIFPNLTVYENLRMGFIENGINSEENTLNDVLARFPRLDSPLDRQGATLSGGEQQILALARSLCGAPKLLLLDEPTEGIQPSIVEEILEILIGVCTAIRAWRSWWSSRALISSAVCPTASC
jgi:urea transport system ATP-binding protein